MVVVNFFSLSLSPFLFAVVKSPALQSSPDLLNGTQLDVKHARR